MASQYNLPVDYTKLSSQERRTVRMQYIKEQGGKCWYCKAPLIGDPHPDIMLKKINLQLMPPNFLKHPIHLQHDHQTGLTEGAVHAYCNVVLWQHDGR